MNLSDEQLSVRKRIEAVMRVEEFSDPAPPDAIDAAERELGVPIPAELREIYHACNGFAGPTWTRYLSSLQDAIKLTRMERQNWGESYPWLEKAALFGRNGVGGSLTVQWGVLRSCPDEILEWCYGDGGEYTLLSMTWYDLWARERRFVEEL